MQGFRSFFLPCHKPTQVPKHLTVYLSQRSKYMTIQRTVILIIVIIVIIAFVLFVIYYCNYWCYCHYDNYWTYWMYLCWLNAIGSWILYELDYRNPVLYVILIQSILGKLPVVTVQVGDTGTIPHHLRNHFPGAPGDSRPDSGDGCRIGLWTHGHWDGPVICNEAGRTVQASVVRPHGERLHVNSPKHHVWGTLLLALIDLRQC